jgi:two-component system sensor histidine kinase KdpD
MNRTARQSLVAVAAAALATLVCAWLDAYMSVAGLAMAYLVAVVATAIALDRGPGLFASLLCVSALNFFFVPPRFTFLVDSPEYLWTLAVLLVVSVLLNGLIASLRSRQARAEEDRARTTQLHGLSETLAQVADPHDMAAAAAQWFQRELGYSTAVFLRDSRCVTSGADAAAFQPSAAQWAMEHGRRLGRGCEDWPDLPLWCAPFAKHDAGGAIQMLLPPRERPPDDEQQHWSTLVRQVGLTIDRERAAGEARTAQESARAESARNTLLASLSHDLRTPLAGILGTASTLRAQSDALPPAQRERLLANLENETRDLATMADNVLQLARLSQPQVQLKKQWESAEEVLGAAASRLRKRWPDARIQLRVTPGLPPIHAEGTLLAQVIANLVDNAVRHSAEEPRIEITAGRSRGGIFIAVRDHGRGLQDIDPATMFDRYRQGASQRDTGAAGLGLAICKLVVDAHDGQVAVRRCDPGTEFRIDLPVHEPATAPAK